MGDGTRSIGAIARESGLSVSALRFYDGAGVLRPARIDPATGYRWYTAEQVRQARLIACLRRVAMPLTDICEVLAARDDPSRARELLKRHLRRLEEGLADARCQLDAADKLLDQEEKPMTTMTVTGVDLTGALAAVRFAMSNDPEFPALGGVLFDYDGTTLRLAATDRYRLAVATVPARNQNGPAVQVIAPLSMVESCAFPPDQEISLRLDSDSLHLDGSQFAAVDAGFPDYRRLLQATPTRQVSVTTAELRHRLTSGPTRTLTQAPGDMPHEISVILLGEDTVDVIEHDQPDAIGLNREFLLEAIDARGASQLVLALDGPIKPLAIRDPSHPDDVSLLMPSRLTSS
jgi:DNA-binding transcriptional MerR regulator